MRHLLVPTVTEGLDRCFPVPYLVSSLVCASKSNINSTLKKMSLIKPELNTNKTKQLFKKNLCKKPCLD